MGEITVPKIRARKGCREPIVMVTAYDFPGAGIADEGGVDIILVGDSVAMVFSGHDDTLAVSIDEIEYHVRAVSRASPRALVVGDMPWLSYHLDVRSTVTNAARLIRAGASAVKLEGGQNRVPMVKALVDAEIPVMGHLGLTPQSLHRLGSYRSVQGKSKEAIDLLLQDAHALEDAGCFSLVLETVPDVVARMITATVGVPTIGIGAGPECDGQILLYHDLLGLEDRIKPKFVRRYADLRTSASEAIARFAEDVRHRRYPSAAESYHLPDSVASEL